MTLFDRFRDADAAGHDLIDEFGAEAHALLLTAPAVVRKRDLAAVAAGAAVSDDPPTAFRPATRDGALTAVCGWHALTIDGASTEWETVDLGYASPRTGVVAATPRSDDVRATNDH